jgi:hypothetical protein
MNLGKRIKVLMIPERVPAQRPVEEALPKIEETLMPLPADWPKPPRDGELAAEVRSIVGAVVYGRPVH